MEALREDAIRSERGSVAKDVMLHNDKKGGGFCRIKWKY
jgi:hypothetical protein